MGSKTHLVTVCFVSLLLAGPVLAQQGETQPVQEEEEQQEVNLQFQVGYNALTDGNLEEATRRFERAVASDTDVPRAYYWLGKTYFYQGYNDSAVDVLRQADTFPEVRDKARRELAMYRLRYRSDTFPFHHDWTYVGLIDGERHDERRNINPSALEPHPFGGWYSSAYRSGKILRYSEEGRVLESWGGFESPTDLKYVEGLGLLVAELEDGRVSLLTDTGTREPFLTEGITAPDRILTVGSSLYVVDSAQQKILQLAPDGDTVGVVWRAPSNVNILDVSVGPDNQFWVLDDRQYQLHVINPDGVRTASQDWNRNLDLRKIWWRRDTLVAVGSDGIISLDQQDFTAIPLSSQGDTLPGDDVSDIHFSGDRLIIASFETSELLIYRPLTTPDPDMLVDQRRFDFSDFPVIRGNLLIQDPLRSHRFEHLGDKNLGIEVNRLDILPSILRHTRETYGNDWIMLVDNRLSALRSWEEIRPYLERTVNQSPDGSNGSIWAAEGSSVIQQSFSRYTTQLNNALNQMDFYPGTDVTEGDTLLAERIHQGFNRLFARRSSGGIIVVSRHFNKMDGALRRIMNRAINNSIPVFLINPSSEPYTLNTSLEKSPAAFYQNFGSLNTNELWGHYRSFQNQHYTMIYRSNLQYQASSLWRNLRLKIHYFDRVHRYQGGFLLP